MSINYTVSSSKQIPRQGQNVSSVVVLLMPKGKLMGLMHLLREGTGAEKETDC